jgi:hypothetical protein
LILKSTAFVVDQDNVELSPSKTLGGVAVIEQVGAGITLTVVEHAPVPPGPVTLPVYVVVAVKAPVDIEPDATGVFETLLIVSEVPLVVVQDIVELPPLLMLAGLGVNAQVGADESLVAVHDAVAPPHDPVQDHPVEEPAAGKVGLAGLAVPDEQNVSAPKFVALAA